LAWPKSQHSKNAPVSTRILGAQESMKPVAMAWRNFSANGTAAVSTIIFALIRHLVAQLVKNNGITWRALIKGGIGNASLAAIESNGLFNREVTGRKPSVGLQMNFLASAVLVMKTEANLPLRPKAIGWSGRTSSIQVAPLTAAGGSQCRPAMVLATTNCSSTRTGRTMLGPVTEH